MSGFSFRRRDRPDQEAESSAAESEEEPSKPVATRVEQIAEYSTRPVDEDSDVPPKPLAPAPPPREAALGHRIDAIVAAAEQAAAQIRSDAEAEAARIRDEAESARADADRTINEADEQVRGLRKDADAYASTKHREAEEEAAAIVARAEERARGLEAETTRRTHALGQRTKRWEENLNQLVAMCRDLADDLEALGTALHEAVPTAAQPTTPDAAAVAQEAVR